MSHLVNSQRANRRSDDSFERDDERKRELVAREIGELERPRHRATIRLSYRGTGPVWRGRDASDA